VVLPGWLSERLSDLSSIELGHLLHDGCVETSLQVLAPFPHEIGKRHGAEVAAGTVHDVHDEPR
jgi:hypothetical protein